MFAVCVWTSQGQSIGHRSFVDIWCDILLALGHWVPWSWSPCISPVMEDWKCWTNCRSMVPETTRRRARRKEKWDEIVVVLNFDHGRTSSEGFSVTSAESKQSRGWVWSVVVFGSQWGATKEDVHQSQGFSGCMDSCRAISSVCQHMNADGRTRLTFDSVDVYRRL